MRSKPLPDLTLLQAAFSRDVNSPSGLTWKQAGRGRTVGKKAGALSKTQGYYVVRFQGRLLLGHRICKALDDSQDPYPLEVDHVDRDTANNTPENLRVVTASANQGNRSKSTGTSSKYLGVSWDNHKGRWKVQISHLGRSIHLGSLVDEDQAARLYDRAVLRLQPPGSTTNRSLGLLPQ